MQTKRLHEAARCCLFRAIQTEHESGEPPAAIFAGGDLLRAEHGPQVLEVNSSPGLEGIEGSSKKDVADLLFQHIERRAASTVKRRKRVQPAG